MKRLAHVAKRGVVAVVAAGALATATLPPAAAGYMHVYGYACPGGSIATTLYYYTANESGASGNFATNEWHIHLNNYDGNETLNISVKCNNGVWYYPSVNISGWASPRNVGWI
jgi:hypothetical protein